MNHLQSFEGVSPLILAVVSIAGAILASALGTALWMQHPASNEVSFGDLMIWSWARSAQARRQLRRSFELLSDESEVMSPHERLVTLREMSAALDRKDPYTYGHSRRVERLAYRTGLALELSVRDIQNLREAASIHDVGKIFVPDEILQKDGPLTPEEYTVIKAHAPRGAAMVAFLDRPELTETVRFHHERWDGKGYPDGIQADSIPLLARIVGTVDAYDAMTSMRSYRASLGHKRAIEILEEERGAQFDPDVVTAFLSSLRKPGLVAISIPLLSGPIEALRRVLGWVGRNARADLATAAGAVGMTVALTGSFAGSVGDAPRRPEEPAVSAAQVMGNQVTNDNKAEAPEASDSERDDAGKKEPRSSNDRNKRKKNKESRKGPKADGKPRGSSSSGGNPSVAAGAGVVDDAAGALGAATSTRSGGDFDPEAPTDPRPGKGSDCKGGGPDSVGGALHCGD